MYFFIVEIENYLPVWLKAATFPNHASHPMCTLNINCLFLLPMPDNARLKRGPSLPFPTSSSFHFSALRPSFEENQETQG